MTLENKDHERAEMKFLCPLLLINVFICGKRKTPSHSECRVNTAMMEHPRDADKSLFLLVSIFHLALQRFHVVGHSKQDMCFCTVLASTIDTVANS